MHSLFKVLDEMVARVGLFSKKPLPRLAQQVCMIASSALNAIKPLHMRKVNVFHTLHDTDREERLIFVKWYDHSLQVVEIQVCPH